MNQIKDIFNTHFFVILGVVLLLVTCLVLYIEQKFKTYDHKMSSMLSLVSSLAEEMDIFRNSRNQSGGHSAIQNEINNINENLEESKLIDVSDDDDDEDEDDNVETDYESESETDSESDTETVDDVNEPKIVNTQELVSNDNEIITITKLEDLQSNDIVDLVEELNDTEEKYDLDELDELDNSLDGSLDGSNNLDDLDDTNVVDETEEINVVEELDDEIEETNVVEELDDIEEINDDAIDYNKLSVAKLKEIALEKNLISNTSNKLKKAELLKLLEGN